MAYRQLIENQKETIRRIYERLVTRIYTKKDSSKYSDKAIEMLTNWRTENLDLLNQGIPLPCTCCEEEGLELKIEEIFRGENE